MIGPLLPPRRPRGQRRASTLATGVALCVVGASSCATTSDFDKLQERVKTLELDRERLHASMDEDVKRLENLHSMLTQAEETLRRSGVNLGMRMEQVEADTPQIRGQVEAVTFQFDSLRYEVDLLKREIFDRLHATSVYLPQDLSKQPEDVWQLAETRRKERKIREAKALLDHFEAAFPDDGRADDALVLLAQMAEQDGDVRRAIDYYKGVYERYRDGDQVTKALWRIAELFIATGDCGRAKGVMGILASDYPQTLAGTKAEARQATVLDECGDGDG